MIKLFGHPESFYTNMIRVLLWEGRIPFDFVKLDLEGRDHLEPDYLKRSPFGRVPSISDGNFHLSETRAVLRYIATEYRLRTWYPSDAKARALVDQWMDRAISYVSDPLGQLRSAKKPSPSDHFAESPDVADQRLKEDLKIRKTVLRRRYYDILERNLAIFDRHLNGAKFLEGDMPTLGDLVLTPYVASGFMKKTGALKGKPNLGAWLERMSTTTEWKKIYTAE